MGRRWSGPYPRDEAIIEEVNAVTDFHTIKTANKDEAVKAGLFNVIGEEVDEAFDKNVLAQIVNPEIIKEQHDLKIVYTPIHGSGNKPVRRVLKKAGFENVTSLYQNRNFQIGEFNNCRLSKSRKSCCI